MAQRQFQRVNHKVPATLHMAYSAGQVSSFEGVVADISISGLCILISAGATPGPVAQGSKAQVVIHKTDGNKLQVTGNVVRSIVDKDGSQQIALRFDRVRYDTVASIQTHQMVVVDINPYGWTDYRQFLEAERVG